MIVKITTDPLSITRGSISGISKTVYSENFLIPACAKQTGVSGGPFRSFPDKV